MTPPRVLLLIPHPDDEVVGAALAIRRAAAAGARIFGLYLTTGVPDPRQLWPWQRAGHGRRVQRRRAEAQAVAGLLGLTPLGFQPWPSRSLKSHLAEAAGLLDALIGQHRIEALWVPAWEGAHQDHDCANFLASRFAARLPVSEFAEYNFAGGRVRIGEFPQTRGGEETLQPNPSEAAWKRGLLARYRSERGNLAHITIAAESFRPLPAHDYTRPAHFGRQFWERFHWVPFAHPRIDFERAGDVRVALAEFSRMDRGDRDR
jgi:LmbE family N-acetylglucosaminyl deacetylase